MNKGWINDLAGDESGFSLLEISMSLPVLSLLLCTMAVSFLWTIRLFVYELADWTLQREMERAMERVMEEGRSAFQVDVSNDRQGTRDYIYFRYSKGSSTCFFADMTNSTWVYKIYRLDSTYPLTGDDAFAQTFISRFNCELEHPGIMRLEILGHCMTTGHAFQLVKEEFLPEMMKKEMAENAGAG